MVGEEEVRCGGGVLDEVVVVDRRESLVRGRREGEAEVGLRRTEF